MTGTAYATFDGEVLRPEGPLAVPPNPRVKITIDEPAQTEDDPSRAAFRALLRD